MDSLNTFALKSNKQFKINFAGGDLSSDAGLFLIKEFAAKIGFEDLVGKIFKTNDHALFRLHTDPQNLLQMIYQTIAAYHRDDDTDELTNDPIMTAVLGKEALASQPTLSRFFSRMLPQRRSSQVKPEFMPGSSSTMNWPISSMVSK